MYALNLEKAVMKPYRTMDSGEKRKHIWEITSDLYCAVCGTCLDLDEQRMILKKLHMDHKNYSDHDIHSLMVQSLHYENKISRRLDSHFNEKYSYEISQFGEHTEKQFMAVWKEHMQSGDICGLFWVAVTHKSLSENAIHTIYCDIHMMSHLNGGKTRQEKKEYDRLLNLNAELQAKLKQEKKKNKDLAKELALSEENCRNLTVKAQKLEMNSPASPNLPQANSCPDVSLDDFKQENRDLQARLRQTENDLREYQEQVHGLEKEKERLESDLQMQKETNLQLFNEIENLIRSLYCDKQECAAQNECCGNLCEKRVLIVGGLTKLRRFYRDLVENLGGSFEYHDGYIHAGERELEGLIKKSDIILCPVDCNSHGACLSVKKICNRINKPYQMLPSSSLSSISQALTGEGSCSQ